MSAALNDVLSELRKANAEITGIKNYISHYGGLDFLKTLITQELEKIKEIKVELTKPVTENESYGIVITSTEYKGKVTAFVSKVNPDSVAAKNGIKVGSQILQINDIPLTTQTTKKNLVEYFTNSPNPNKVKLTYIYNLEEYEKFKRSSNRRKDMMMTSEEEV